MQARSQVENRQASRVLAYNSTIYEVDIPDML